MNNVSVISRSKKRTTHNPWQNISRLFHVLPQFPSPQVNGTKFLSLDREWESSELSYEIREFKENTLNDDVVVEHCEILAVKDFIEKPNLLNFVNFSAMPCIRLQSQLRFFAFQSVN